MRKKHLKCTDLEAAQIAEKHREMLLESKKNFSFETVLSTDRNLNLLKRAKEKYFYDDGCSFWSVKDIEALTNIKELDYLNLNK